MQQILDHSDRYAIVLTDKDDARLFLFFQERIEEVTTLKDEIPGRVRYPTGAAKLSMRKHIESYHAHFDSVGEAAFRLLQREPFEHLIIGGLWETLSQFEGRLHRYLRDRIVARWDIDVQHSPTQQIEEWAQKEEQQLLELQPVVLALDCGLYEFVFRPGKPGPPSGISGPAAGPCRAVSFSDWG